MPIQASNVTHNNNGHFYRIAIDIAKEGSEVWDLTPYFKGRVGDDNFGLQIVWYYQGRLLDVTGKTPYIKGNVGHYSFDDQKNLQLAPDADVVVSHGNPNDCQANGQATYYFPQQMFMTDGIFKGFIGLQDDNQNLTGVDIWFRVLPGVARMGHACDFYVDILDKTIADFKEKIRQQSIDFDAALQQELQKEKDLIQQKLDAASDAIDTDKATLEKLAASVGAIQDQIDSKNIVTEKEFKIGLDSARKSMEDILKNATSGAPKPIKDLMTLQSTYPNGTDGFFVANDNNHRYAYVDNSWKDLGLYQSNGILDNSIDRTKLSDTYASPYDFLYGIKINLDQFFKEGNYILSKDDNGDIPRGLPLDANLDKYIYMLENRVAGHNEAIYVHQTLIRSDGASYERFLSKSGKFNTDWNYVQENGLFIKAVAKEGLREIHLDLTDYELYNQNGETSSFKSQQASDPGYPQMAVYKAAQKFPVSAGDKYVIYGYTDSTMLYALTDTNGKVYTSISGQKELYRWHFTVSQDGYLLVNSLYGKTRLWKVDGTQAINGEKLIEESVKMPALQSSIQNSFYAQTEILQAQKNDHGVYKADGSLVYSSATSSIGKVHVASGESYRITSSEVDGIAILLFDGNNNLTRSFGAKDIVIPSENEWSIAVNGNNAKIEHIVGYLPKTLIGQNWCALGDSLTSKYTLGEGVPNYVQLVAERTGVTYYQQGHGGGGYLADSNAFLSLFPKDNSDIVTIFGSFNDVYVNDFRAGEAGTTDTSTLWGAVKKVIDNCYSVNPDIRIGLIAPTPWISVNPQQTGTNEAISEAFSHQGAKAGEDYVQTLKEISDYYSIPFLDLYHNSGLRVYDQDWDDTHTHVNELGKGDGGHLNTRGSKIIANKMIKFIESL